MSCLAALRLALTMLLVNKGRSALTGLGIVIGMSAIVGTTPDFQRVCNWQVTHGRLFDAEEARRSATVCLIGQTVLHRLFPDRLDPSGEKIVVGALRLRIVGVLGSKGATPLGVNQAA